MGQSPDGQAGGENRSGESGQTAQQSAHRQRPSSREGALPERVAGWFTETLVRAGVAVFGVALLLFALGRLVGVDLLETVVDVLASSTGAWVIIAFFAMLLIVAASKSWNVDRH
jgi:hypothetical protein